MLKVFLNYSCEFVVIVNLIFLNILNATFNKIRINVKRIYGNIVISICVCISSYPSSECHLQRVIQNLNDKAGQMIFVSVWELRRP